MRRPDPTPVAGMDEGVRIPQRPRSWVVVEDGEPVETHAKRRSARRAAERQAEAANPYVSVLIIGLDGDGEPVPTSVEIIQHGLDPTTN